MDCNNNSVVSRFIRNCGKEPVQKCVNGTKGIEYAVDLLQEGFPYTITKNILGENIYTWNMSFINRVMLSFSSTVMQSFSRIEKDLLDRYKDFLIYELEDVADEDVKELDKFIGTIGE